MDAFGVFCWLRCATQTLAQVWDGPCYALLLTSYYQSSALVIWNRA